MQFAEIPGLDDLKNSLVASYKNNHIAHAQLFNSALGGGGLPVAISFATYLLCENKQDQDSCGECANCQKMAKLIHPDVHFIYPKPSASKSSDYDKLQTETLKKWRTFAAEKPYSDINDWVAYNGYENKNVLISREDSRNIIRTVSMKSFEGDFKILIIWYPEFMHPAAANGILKVLEEPPTQTIYLLVSYAYDNLLATIKSRTQIFNVTPFKEDVIKEYLIEKKGVDQTSAEKVARISNGSLGKAIYELENADKMAYEAFRNWMQMCLKGDYSGLLNVPEDLVILRDRWYDQYNDFGEWGDYLFDFDPFQDHMSHLRIGFYLQLLLKFLNSGIEKKVVLKMANEAYSKKYGKEFITTNSVKK